IEMATADSSVHPACPITTHCTCFQSSRDRRDIHSFPTRRSSDLCNAPESKKARRCGKNRKPRKFFDRFGCSRCVQKTYAVSCFRSEEHTSELQSHLNLVCRLLLEKKKAIDHEIEPAFRYTGYCEC